LDRVLLLDWSVRQYDHMIHKVLLLMSDINQKLQGQVQTLDGWGFLEFVVFLLGSQHGKGSGRDLLTPTVLSRSSDTIPPATSSSTLYITDLFVVPADPK
jgi:hypothetical protein